MEAQILSGEPTVGSGSGSGSGYGYGYGSGYGDGDGDGSGYGYGYGYGSGYGYGDGDGSGYGYGDSSGYGYGDSSGYGYGDGDGSGYGYGDSSGSYWQACQPYFLAKLPTDQQERFAAAKDAGLKIAFWRSDKNGKPSNGGSGVKAEPGAIHREEGPLSLCSRGTLHATLIPPKWKGERMWIVALHGEVVGDDEKYGCLVREVIGECL